MKDGVPDPNNDVDREAFLYWVKFGDYYQWEHIIQFDSFDTLKHLIETTDFQSVSRKVKEFADRELKKVRQEWLDIILSE